MKYISGIALACLLLCFTACKRQYDTVAVYQPVDSSMSYLKVVHASPNFRTIFGRDTFNVLVNGQKINGSAFVYNSIAPFAVNSTTTSITATYAAIPSGQQTIKLSVPGIIKADSIEIYSFTKTFVPAKFYTLLITDSLKTTKDSSQIFVQDNFPPAVTGYYNLRFINAAMNDTAGKTVDVFSYARNGTLFTNIKPGGTTSFSLLNYNPGVPDTFYVTRNATAGTPLANRIVLAKIAATTANIGGGSMDQRSYTLFYKGDATTTTGTRPRSLGFFINK